MEKIKAILPVFLAVFLCLSVSAVYAQGTHAQINSVSLNGQGDYLKIEPGGLIGMEVFYEFLYPYPLPKKIVEIVVGFEDTPGICLIDGLLDDITGLTGVFDHKMGFGMIAPTEPGIYHIMRVRTEGYTCQGARELYRDYPSTRKIIGTIEVIASESDERDQGAIEVTHVSLDFVGLEDWFDVEPGELLEARVCYDYLYPWHLQKHEYRVVVGSEDTALFCIDEEIRRKYLGNTGDGSDCTIFTIKAPMDPGIYSIYKTYTKGLTCSEAKEHYENNPDAREIIDHFEVRADEPDEPDDPDEWVCIYENRTALKPKNFGTNYTIRINQRQSELQMEIITPYAIWVQHGSVSISLAEDVDVIYCTGNVTERLLGKTEFKQIEINPDNEVAGKAITLIVGLIIPYAGTCMGIAGLYDEIIVNKNDFAMYSEVDRTKDFDFSPLEVFTVQDIQNLRDVVIVPWRVTPSVFGANAVKVNFPRMTFPHEGIHNVIFCIDCKIHNNDVRHYIGLPIEIGKQKVEA